MDNDSQLLANRIAMLASEEQKLLRKIEDSKRKAQKIVELK